MKIYNFENGELFLGNGRGNWKKLGKGGTFSLELNILSVYIKGKKYTFILKEGDKVFKNGKELSIHIPGTTKTHPDTDVYFPITRKYKLTGGYEKGRIEKDFQAEIERNLRRDGCFTYHVRDVGLWHKLLDLIVITGDGEMCMIECKKIKGYTFNVSSFTQSQIDLLTRLEKRNPHLVRIYIYSEKLNDYKSVPFKEIWNGKGDGGGYKVFNNK